MIEAKPIPKYLAKRYHGWKATDYEENRAWLNRLADEGQRPRVMVISCCDSRVQATSLLGAEAGEFFMHRNIANLVPPFDPDGGHHGTSAAIEYAVTALHVSNIIVVGHSNCGGVRGCHDVCKGKAPQLEEKTSFVGQWLQILKPGYEVVKDTPGGEDAVVSALEKEGVVLSLRNLMTFPFVSDAVNGGQLDLHGLWTDIRDGGLEWYDPVSGHFKTV